MSWIGFDLDGTLAEWGPGFNEDVYAIGNPVPSMVAHAKALLAEGHDVRIVTARVGASGKQSWVARDDVAFAEAQRALIERWCEQHLGQKIPVTATKDFEMHLLFDDRAVSVEANTGRICSCVARSPVTP